MSVIDSRGPSIRAIEHHSFASVPQTAFICCHLVEEAKTSLCNFELKPESVPVLGYATRWKQWPIVEKLK